MCQTSRARLSCLHIQPCLPGCQISLPKSRRMSLYLRLNLTISSTSQTYLLVQHQSKATLTRGNIVGKLHNSLCHTQDKKRSKQLTCLKQQYRRRTWSIFIANSMCPDLSWFACEQSQHGEREPLHATSWLKASSILHKQAHRKIFYINGRVTRENLTFDFGHTRGEDSSSSAHLTSKLHCAFSHRHVSRHNPLTLCTRNYLHMVSGARSRLNLPSFNKERIPEDGKHA